MTSNKFKLFLAATICMVVGSVGCCLLYSYTLEWKAKRCLQMLMSLRVGVDSQHECENRMSVFSGFEVDGTASTLNVDYPLRTYTLLNSGKHLLGILRPTGFQASFVFHNGILVSKTAALFQEPYKTVRTRESLVGFDLNGIRSDASSGVTVGVYDPAVRVDVFVDQRSTAQIKQDAFSYDLTCLTRIGGCASVYELQPQIRQLALAMRH